MPTLLDDGFDSSYCIVTAEQLFGITMADEEVEKLRTAGELHEHILHRLRLTNRPVTQAGPCPTAASFYRLHSRFKLARPDAAEFRPDTPVASLLLPGDLRASWLLLSHELGIQLPTLVYNPATHAIALALLLISVISATIAGGYLSGGPAAFGCAVFMIVASLFLLIFLDHWGRPRFAQTIPPEAQTIGDLAHFDAYTQIESNPPRSWSHQEAWIAVQAILASSAGVSPRQIKKETTFGELNTQSL
jgi:hypothetical protein